MSVACTAGARTIVSILQPRVPMDLRRQDCFQLVVAKELLWTLRTYSDLLVYLGYR
jgi:hypothetical protein